MKTKTWLFQNGSKWTQWVLENKRDYFKMGRSELSEFPSNELVLQCVTSILIIHIAVSRLEYK